MNDKQQKILIGAAVAILGALLYPPFHFVYPNGVVINLGYGFIFDPPLTALGQSIREGSVTISIVMVEWVAIILVAGILWFIAKNKPSEQGK